MISATATPTSAPAAGAAIDWREVGRWAALGLLGLVLLVVLDVHRYGGNNPVSMVQPGADGPATELFARDFPDLEQPEGVGLDGQAYYAMARDPLHLDETARYLDGPRYRFQRPLLPWLAWALHPTGGGTALIGALVLVSFLGIAVGAFAAGGLSMALRGPPWVAAVFPLLPGAYWSLRVTVSDALALGLALAAVLLAARSRLWPAVAVGCLAVLAKEPAVLILLGWALHRRTRRDALIVLVPGAVIVAWMAWLHLALPPDVAAPAGDVTLPFVGLYRAWTQIWSQGRELVGMACTLGGLAVGVTALSVRRLRHPLGWALAVQVGFVLLMGLNPTSTNFGGTRMAMPLMILGLIALVTPHGAEALDDHRALVE